MGYCFTSSNPFLLRVVVDLLPSPSSAINMTIPDSSIFNDSGEK